MGVDITTYVGPYIEVYNPETPSTEEYYSCTNSKCKQHKRGLSSKFCPDCGKSVGIIKIPSKEKINIWEFIDEKLEGTLQPVMTEYKPNKNYEFLVPNEEILKRDTTFDAKQETYIVEIDSSQISEEAFKMCNKFRKEIDILKEKFGNDSVTIKWGVIGWMM